MRQEILRIIVRLSRSLAGTAPQQDDSALLLRVAHERDGEAFAALLERHGRLVWGVCRGMLPNDADAEDAFQATFVALFRGAAKVRRVGSLAPWLHGTATRIAQNARRAAARRSRREHRAAKPESAPPAASDETWVAIHAALHDEIAGLSGVLREAFVLCVLQGQRHEDAAARLGVPVGTLSARVSRAKARLLERLRSRGLDPSVVVPVACGATTLAAVPGPLLLLLRRHLADGFASVPQTILELAASVAGGTSMKMKALVAALIVAVLGAAVGGFWLARPPEKERPTPERSATVAAPAEAADLVRKVRQNQAWATKAKTLRVRFEGKRLSPGEGKELIEKLEIAFDERRLLRRFEWKDFYSELRVWDGKRATVRLRHAGAEPDSFILSAKHDPVSEDLLAHTFWLWNQPHSFWWTRPIADAKQRETLEEQQGRPEDFVLTARETYRGVPCYVLHRKGWQLMRWYVGEKTGLLHGIAYDSLPGNPDAVRLAVEVAATNGKELKTEEQFYDWIDALGPQKGNPIALSYFEKRHPTDRPKTEVWLLDYEEIQPGRWFPRTQTWTDYKGDHGKPVIDNQTAIRAVEVALDELLPEALFLSPAPAEGARIDDQTTDPPLVYQHKKDRTPAEWQAMRAAALRERKEEEKARAARDALIGTPAPPLPKDGWINSPPLSWDELKGKAVLLVFWSEWCGACQGYLPLLRKGDVGPCVIIGVHTPGSAKEEVERALSNSKADGPVFIDLPSKELATWGATFRHFRLNGLPSAVLIVDGKLAAHGDPFETYRKAVRSSEKRGKSSEKCLISG